MELLIDSVPELGRRAVILQVIDKLLAAFPEVGGIKRRSPKPEAIHPRRRGDRGKGIRRGANANRNRQIGKGEGPVLVAERGIDGFQNQPVGQGKWFQPPAKNPVRPAKPCAKKAFIHIK
jgi:hypothetical protein